MPKYVGPALSGTIGELTYYKLFDEQCVRAKSSLDGKRVKTDPSFKRTMEYAALLGSASKLAAGVYRLLPKEERKFVVYRLLTGMAMRALRDGQEETAITGMLKDCMEFILERMNQSRVLPANELQKKPRQVNKKINALLPRLRCAVTMPLIWGNHTDDLRKNRRLRRKIHLPLVT